MKNILPSLELIEYLDHIESGIKSGQGELFCVRKLCRIKNIINKKLVNVKFLKNLSRERDLNYVILYVIVKKF